MDKEGFGTETDTFQWYIKWCMFSSIYETKQYIFMKQIDGPYHVLFKNRLPDETVTAIREILASAPIVDYTPTHCQDKNLVFLRESAIYRVF